MVVKFRTAIKDGNEYIIFTRKDFEEFITYTMQLTEVINNAVEGYFGKINYEIDETFKHRKEKQPNQS